MLPRIREQLRSQPTTRPIIPDEVRRRFRPSVQVSADYLACNALQIEWARRASWSRVYRQLGAPDADIDQHVADKFAAMTAICQGRTRSHHYGVIAERIVAFQLAVDKTVAERLDVPLDSAFALRRGMLEDIQERFQLECLESPIVEAQMLFGKMPLSPDLNVELPESPLMRRSAPVQSRHLRKAPDRF